MLGWIVAALVKSRVLMVGWMYPERRAGCQSGSKDQMFVRFDNYDGDLNCLPVAEQVLASMPGS